MSHLKQVIFALFLFGSGPVFSQAQVKEIDAISQDILDAVRLAPIETIVSVSGDYLVEGNVIKADQLVMDCNSRITFKSVDHPWLIVAAKRLKFKDAGGNCSHIFRRAVSISAPPGSTGADGSLGNPNYVHHQGGQGRHGGHGTAGSSGGVGGTLHHPPVYFVIGNLEAQTGNSLEAKLFMFFRGITGGQGGLGGNGGSGGSGEKGGDAADGLLDCRRGPGRGGNAGNGGTYGIGGQGGPGGNGPSIYLVGPRHVVDTLSFAGFMIAGGIGGPGGECGQSGNPGMTGDQGRLSNRCRSGPGPGARGTKPNRPAECKGPDGKDGGRGSIFAAAIDINNLF